MSNQKPPYRIAFRKGGQLITELDCYALPSKGDVVTLDDWDYLVDRRHFQDLTEAQQVVSIEVITL